MSHIKGKYYAEAQFGIGIPEKNNKPFITMNTTMGIGDQPNNQI